MVLVARISGYRTVAAEAAAWSFGNIDHHWLVTFVSEIDPWNRSHFLRLRDETHKEFGYGRQLNSSWRRKGVTCHSSPVQLDRRFFEQDAKELAEALVGTILVRRGGALARRARVVETEAYLGPKDLASHSSKGRTARTEVMFGPAGHAYVYFVYGMHWMFNVVAGTTGEAHAVLVRAAEPLDGWEVDLTWAGEIGEGFWNWAGREWGRSSRGRRYLFCGGCRVSAADCEGEAGWRSITRSIGRIGCCGLLTWRVRWRRN